MTLDDQSFKLKTRITEIVDSFYVNFDDTDRFCLDMTDTLKAHAQQKPEDVYLFQIYQIHTYLQKRDLISEDIEVLEDLVLNLQETSTRMKPVLKRMYSMKRNIFIINWEDKHNDFVKFESISDHHCSITINIIDSRGEKFMDHLVKGIQSSCLSIYLEKKLDWLAEVICMNFVAPFIELKSGAIKVNIGAIVSSMEWNKESKDSLKKLNIEDINSFEENIIELGYCHHDPHYLVDLFHETTGELLSSGDRNITEVSDATERGKDYKFGVNRRFAFFVGRKKKCKVSVQVQTIVEMIYEILGSQEKMIERYSYCRSILELYWAIGFHYWKSEIEKDTRRAMVFHNDCLYITYHLSTLAYHHRLSLRDNDTFIDLIPLFRDRAIKIFLGEIDKQKESLLKFVCPQLTTAELPLKDAIIINLENSIKNAMKHLIHLSREWYTVLPNSSFSKVMLSLTNEVCAVFLKFIEENKSRMSKDDINQFQYLILNLETGLSKISSEESHLLRNVDALKICCVSMSTFSFGSFSYFCSQASLPLCSAIKLDDPSCYSRNVDINGFLMFQPSTLVVHIIAIIMTLIMIYNIKSKYTAVGRKEMVQFFYLYLFLTIVEFLLLSNIIPTGSTAYNVITAVHVALISSMFWILLLNGFVGFQWAEDGTRQSLLFFRLTGLGVFAVVFFIALGTFLQFAGLGPNMTTPLFIIYFCVNGLALIVYIITQIFLVVNTLDDRWPLGDILFGVLSFIVALILNFVVSTMVCDMATHYIDGLFFGTTFNLLAVMMVYKYWDSITKEDLEFCVAGGPYPWDSNISEPIKKQ
ncbi:Chitin synthase III catalytic subunit domain-containing protein [Rozella allomycis CSF55]|uniref:Chitin synthase III catalytic subunit domain-containing protein n=1 Tax=Rozella allomycis (strain CSF55) TaxID=988480 RepID=A0A075AX29_ROZAC|nr:Chitin synthase III catalytic subunit domain-containing protein [Rozella allomycis CSF55]|eukprot:EPZ33277.1 Chitin synthase III catalytic subunit domain-containing protein [Rozella allomycis CSF55]